MTDLEFIKNFKSSYQWALDDCKVLCNLAGLDDEWESVDKEKIENAVCKALEILENKNKANKYWFAVRNSEDPNYDCSSGSHNFAEAVDMLGGYYKYDEIIVVTDDDDYCLGTIKRDENGYFDCWTEEGEVEAIVVEYNSNLNK